MKQISVGTVGKRLRMLRQERDLTQEQLAARAGLTMRTVRRIEQGEDARLGTLQAIAGALEVPLTALIETAA